MSSPARNEHLERGRPITVDDIRPHANKGCTRCRGKGIMPRGDRAIQPEVCRCATKRFLKAHPMVIMDGKAQAWWPARCDRCAGPNKPGTDQCERMCNAAGEVGKAGDQGE